MLHHRQPLLTLDRIAEQAERKREDRIEFVVMAIVSAIMFVALSAAMWVGP